MSPETSRLSRASDDYETLQSIGDQIKIQRLSDIRGQSEYVLHCSQWWRVLDPADSSEGVEAFILEIAGPRDPKNPETDTLTGRPDDLIIYTEVGAGLQFRSGVLQDVLWPDSDLIYVGSARRRSTWSGIDERVSGLFSRRYDSDGDAYYAPVDPESQPEVQSHWILDPKYDLIMDWAPVDVAGLLEEFRGGGHA